MFQELVIETQNTVFTALLASMFATAFSLPFACILSLTQPETIKNHPFINNLIFFIISICNNLTFVVTLLVLMAAKNYFLFTISIDSIAILALTLIATPKLTFIIQKIIDENKKNLIETGTSLGANNWQIVTNIILPSCSVKIMNSILNMFNDLISYSLIAGLLGGNGLGKLLYNSTIINLNITIAAIILLILFSMSNLIKLFSFSTN